MLSTLRILLYALGASAIGIALSDILLGPTATAGFFEGLFVSLTGAQAAPTGRWPATMDNEMRFYAVFWGAYGLALILVARDFAARGHLTPWLAGLFFVGGVGRAISYAVAGAPHPFFTALMAVELLTPPLLVLLWLGSRRAT
jgi:hypothetical protein